MADGRWKGRVWLTNVLLVHAGTSLPGVPAVPGAHLPDSPTTNQEVSTSDRDTLRDNCHRATWPAIQSAGTIVCHPKLVAVPLSPSVSLSLLPVIIIFLQAHT